MKNPEPHIIDFINEYMTISGTGDIVWIENKRDSHGKVIGKIGESVGNVVTVSGYKYATYTVRKEGNETVLMLSRVAWYLYAGEWPTGTIVLKDNDPRNFSIDNIAMYPDRTAHVISQLEKSIKSANFNISKKTYKDGSVMFYVAIGDTYSLRSKKKRYYFKTEQEAKDFRLDKMRERLDYLREGMVELVDVLKRGKS